MDAGDDHLESFEELLRIDCLARDAIKNHDLSGSKKVSDLKKQRQANDRNITELKGILVTAMTSGIVAENDAEQAYAILESEKMAMWPDKIKEFLSLHETTGDAESLAKVIMRFASDNYLSVKDESQALASSKDKDSDGGLRLVGAMFVMNKFDPKFGKRGLGKIQLAQTFTVHLDCFWSNL